MRAAGAWRRFSLFFADAALLTVGLCFARILYFDPYWVFRAAPPWLAEAGNRLLDNEGRRAKPVQALLREPSLAIVGSSVVYRGLDTETLGRDAYNFGISALMARELPVIGSLLAAMPRCRTVIFGLDYFMFTDFDVPESLDPRFESAAWRRLMPLRTMFALHLLMTTRESIAKVSEPGRWSYTGFRTTPDRPPRVTRWIDARQDGDFLPYRPERLDALRQALAGLRGKRVTVYLSPINEAQRRHIRALGREAEFERWKRDVSQVSGASGARFLDLTTVDRFEDFDPAKGSSEFWFDNLHFKPTVGAWVMARLGLSPQRDGD